jgi:parallel beta-helix repeat protein
MIYKNNIVGGRALRIAVGMTALVLLMVGGAGATKYIKDDATGGDCTSFGTWNAATTTCIMTTDLTEDIWIINNGVTLDGNGRTITGSTTISGIFLSEVSGVLVKNMNINNFYTGVSLYNSTNNYLIGNNASNNTNTGIVLGTSSDNNILIGNTASNTHTGIIVDFSSNNTLTSNNFLNNNNWGIVLNSASDNTLSGNNASNNYGGIILSYSSNNTLSGNNASNNTWGVSVFYSINNTLNGNTASKNEYNGIYLDYSSNNNMLIDNTLIGNSDNISIGIQLRRSSNILLTGNNVSNNNNGIYLFSSSNDTVSNNNASNNSNGLFLDASSDNNTLIRNNFPNNNNGIRVSSSSINTLSSNNASNNNKNGIYLTNSSNNIIYNNYFNNINNYRLINGSGNIWNITGISGINIIGGSYRGGNFWGYPNGTGFSQTCADANSDGICDSPYILDSNNTDYLPLALPTGTPVESSTGNGTVFFNTDTGVIENLTAVNVSDIPEAPPGGANLYYGLFRFNITGITPGSSVNLTLIFPSNLLASTTYWKYGATITNPILHWYTIPSTINGSELTIMLTDGGAGDDDLTANGKIRDDGGIAIPSGIDNFSPSVSYRTASHEIPDDTDNEPLWGETAQLNVTVTDDSGVASVTINLSEIGGPAAKPMINIGGTIWSTTTNASAGTPPKIYNLTVNATDIFGNSNTSVVIPLRVMKNGDCTGNGVVNIGDALRLANNVSFPGNLAYTLSSPYVCEVTGNGVINIGDALRLANNVSYPGNPLYMLK